MMDEETLTEQKAVSMIRQAECVDKQIGFENRECA